MRCEAIEWRDGPALAPWSEHSVDADCVHVAHYHAQPITDCRATLSSSDANALTTALADPGVRASLALAPNKQGEIILGLDGRAMDVGSRTLVMGGKRLVVGGACSDTPSCVAPSPGIVKLLDQLFAMNCP